MNILTLDMGGTSIKSAILDEKNRLTQQRTTPSNSTDPTVLAQAAIAIAESYRGFDVVSVSMTGQIDHRSQTVLFRYFTDKAESARGVSVGDMLKENLKCPVFLLNDANAAALGEAYLGAGKGHKDFLLLTYGTGVGGAIIQNGQLFTGNSGIAGEVGHMVTHAGGRLCGCGHRGCYEQYASTSALVRTAKKTHPQLENAKQLFEAAQQDKRLQSLIRRWEKEIVEGLCTLTYICNPGCIVLGGGVMEREDVLTQIRQIFYKRVIPTFAQVTLVPAQLGNRAGMFGAGVYARQQLGIPPMGG